jgi:hypothetical protein
MDIFFYQIQHDCCPQSTPLAWLGSQKPFSVSLIEDKIKKPPFWHEWDDRVWIAGSTACPHRTRLLGCI